MVKIHESMAPRAGKSESSVQLRAGDSENKEINRFSLELPAQIIEILNGIQREGGLRTRTETIVATIALTEWMMRHAKKGRLIASIDPKTKSYTELDSPLLAAARASGGQRRNRE